jgi:hypothetical protein
MHIEAIAEEPWCWRNLARLFSESPYTEADLLECLNSRGSRAYGVTSLSLEEIEYYIYTAARRSLWVDTRWNKGIRNARVLSHADLYFWLVKYKERHTKTVQALNYLIHVPTA